MSIFSSIVTTVAGPVVKGLVGAAFGSKKDKQIPTKPKPFEQPSTFLSRSLKDRERNRGLGFGKGQTSTGFSAVKGKVSALEFANPSPETLFWARMFERAIEQSSDIRRKSEKV